MSRQVTACIIGAFGLWLAIASLVLIRALPAYEEWLATPFVVGWSAGWLGLGGAIFAYRREDPE